MIVRFLSLAFVAVLVLLFGDYLKNYLYGDELRRAAISLLQDEKVEDLPELVNGFYFFDSLAEILAVLLLCTLALGVIARNSLSKATIAAAVCFPAVSFMAYLVISGMIFSPHIDWHTPALSSSATIAVITVNFLFSQRKSKR